MKISDIIAAAQEEPARFRAWLAFILKWECNLAADGEIRLEQLGDGAGVTLAGLESRDDGLIGNPTPQWIVNTYREKYWKASKADQLPAPVGEIVGNYWVNIGGRYATTLLQRALNLNGLLPLDAIDGILGDKTLQGAWQSQNTKELGMTIIAKGDSYYQAIAIGGREKWLQGWLNRNQSLRETWCS